MAQKQYSFDFVLNAVLNGGFSGVFSKAQQEFIRLGAEIKNLQAIQRDVKAYEKQAAAVQNTSQKLENLKRQYELVNKQIGETTGSTTALEREKLKLEQRITNTEAALEKQKQKLGETKDRLDAAGVSTGDLADKDAELAAKIQELTEEQKKAAESAGEFGNAGVQAIEAVGGAIAAAGIAEAMKGIADAYSECVGVAGDFEQAMSAVEAIADSNASEMAALKAEAKELGATTKFTAQQSANAMEYMAMAGWDASEMLAGMPGVINLAAAANEDLAQVSDIVTDNLTAFGLKASDTAHFADVLAAAAANSNTNISIMGETFKSSAAVAGALRYSIEDVAVATGLMANAGVKGSRAGTTLRNIFNGLLGGVTLTAEAFGELDYSAVNSDGSMKGLTETVKDLRGYFDQMTESERVSNAMTLAGMRGYTGLLAILNATDEDFQSLYQSVTNCTGAAERMAAVKLDNLNGDITLMNSAMEALQSTIGEQFTPELRVLTQLKTELLNGANQFIQDNPPLVKGIMAGAAAFGVMGIAIVGVNAAIRVFKALELATLFTGPAGSLLGVAGGIAGAAAAVTLIVDAARNADSAVRELTTAAREMDAAMEEAGSAYEDTAADILATANTAEFYIKKLQEIEAAEGENAAQNQEYQNTLALLLQIMPELSDCISTTTDQYGRATYALNTTTEELLKNAEAWRENAKAQAYQEYYNTVMEQYKDVLLEAAKNEVELTKARYDQEEASQKYSAAVERMNELYDQAAREAEAYARTNGGVADTTAFLTQEYYDLQSALYGLEQEMFDAQSSVDAHEKATEKDAEAVAAAEEEMNGLERAIKDVLTAMGLYTDEQDEVTEGEREVKEVIDETKASVQALAEAYAGVYDEALKNFSGQFGLFDEAQADADATVEAAQKALDTQLSFWQGYGANIAALKEISAEDLGVTQENYDALMEYVRSGTPEAAGLAANMIKAVNDGDTEVLTKLANTLGEISESQDKAAEDVAEWAAGLDEQMDQVVKNMEEDIAALNLSGEAAANARSTIQAYINAATSMLPQVKSAYSRVASEARLALASSAVVSAIQNGTYHTTSEYASGTDNAPPGWAWVGEEGPELMRLHGGEQILPSHVSQEAARTYQAYSRYSGEYEAARAAQGIQGGTPALEVLPGGQTSSVTAVEMHFHIESGASPETVNAWRDYANSGEMRATILEVMEDAQSDARRRALA